MKIFVLTFLALLAFYLLFEVVRFANLVRVSSGIIARARPYEHATGAISMLVLGDSTAYGVGTTNSEDSVAGRLGRSLQASVENYAKSGAVVEDLDAQLAQAKRDHYDIVLIQAGGNDVIRFRSLMDAEAEMDSILKKAKQRADTVVLLTSGRVGQAPLFPWFLRKMLTARSGDLREKFMAIAAEDKVIYVDLFAVSKQFNVDPDTYYAADGLHPTGAGYAIWFSAVQAALAQNGQSVHGK